MAEGECIGYVRVSTMGQAVHGISLEAQNERIEAWALFAKRAVSRIYIERGKSGRKHRPQLLLAIEHAIRLKCPLVVYKFDRMARTLEELKRVDKKLQTAGCSLVSISEGVDTTTSFGRVIFHIIGALAEFEADQTADRVKMVQKHLRDQGKVSCGIPYGWQRGPKDKLIEHPGEQRGLARMKELHAAGDYPRHIAQVMEGEGHAKKNGRTEWYAADVIRILKRHGLTFAPVHKKPG